MEKKSCFAIGHRHSVAKSLLLSSPLKLFRLMVKLSYFTTFFASPPPLLWFYSCLSASGGVPVLNYDDRVPPIWLFTYYYITELKSTDWQDTSLDEGTHKMKMTKSFIIVIKVIQLRFAEPPFGKSTHNEQIIIVLEVTLIPSHEIQYYMRPKPLFTNSFNTLWKY